VTVGEKRIDARIVIVGLSNSFSADLGWQADSARASSRRLDNERP
jgi:hypothetical protein